jgi:sec-independent protein translocase protein TatC
VSAVTDDDSDIEASRAPLLDHLTELRTRLIICVGALAVGFVGCFFFSQDVYLILVRPLQMATALVAETKVKHGPFDLLMAVTGLKTVTQLKPVMMQATAPLEFFFTKMKLSFFGAIVITFPVIAWQLYRFIAPGLYRRERRAFLPFLLASPVLFAMGAALVYFVMLPFVLWFSLSQNIQTAQVQVNLIPKVSDYLDLITKLLLAFGLCFQLPVVLSLLGLAGLVSSKMLAGGRRFAIVGIAAVACFVTPPDFISPFLLGFPIYGLYESSILCVWLIERGRKSRDLLAT